MNEDGSREAKTPPGIQRTFSACPIALAVSSRETSDHAASALHAALGGSDSLWPHPEHWRRDSELPPTPLQRIPFRTDRSVSLNEGGGGCCSEARTVSSRYKTELCRTFEESGTCKYGAKCQFAHGAGELRGLSRHPKYKTEPCRTFHTSGICPYGARCHFIHNAEEGRATPQRAQLLRPSLHSGGSPAELLPPPPVACSLHLPDSFFPCDALGQSSLGCSLCTTLGSSGAPLLPSGPPPFAFPGLSSDSLSDQEDSGGSSGSESPGLGPPGRRLPIFSRLSISDD